MPSRRFRELTIRIGQLEKLLPALSPIGTYTLAEYDFVRSFRLLAHAEIEAFLEDRARSVADDAVRRWHADRRPRRVLLGLLVFHAKSAGLSEQNLRNLSTQPASHISNSIDRAHQQYRTRLSKNHGIREENLLGILLPLGLEGSDIDTAWLATTDGFGARRGETAHTAIAVQQPLDPQTERQTVKDIVAGLDALDRTLSEVR